jgi:hypothetical protein
MPHSLKRTQDLSYDLPPTDEGKGETGAESDRYLGNPTVTHQTMVIRYPAGTMTGSRQKNAAAMKTIGLRNRASHVTASRRRLSKRPSRPSAALAKSRAGRAPTAEFFEVGFLGIIGNRISAAAYQMLTGSFFG